MHKPPAAEDSKHQTTGRPSLNPFQKPPSEPLPTYTPKPAIECLEVGTNFAGKAHADERYGFLESFDTIFLIDDSGALCGESKDGIWSDSLAPTGLRASHSINAKDACLEVEAQNPGCFASSECVLDLFINPWDASGQSFKQAVETGHFRGHHTLFAHESRTELPLSTTFGGVKLNLAQFPQDLGSGQGFLNLLGYLQNLLPKGATKISTSKSLLILGAFCMLATPVAGAPDPHALGSLTERDLRRQQGSFLLLLPLLVSPVARVLIGSFALAWIIMQDHQGGHKPQQQVHCRSTDFMGYLYGVLHYQPLCESHA